MRDEGPALLRGPRCDVRRDVPSRWDYWISLSGLGSWIVIGSTGMIGWIVIGEPGSPGATGIRP